MIVALFALTQRGLAQCASCDVYLTSSDGDYTTTTNNEHICVASGQHFTGDINVNHTGVDIDICGTWTLNNGFNESEGSLTIDVESGAILNVSGSGSLDLQYSSGTGPAFTNAGTLNYSANNELKVSGNGTSGPSFTNNATANVTGSGSITITNKGALTNTGTFTASGSGNIQTNNGGYFTNSGTFDHDNGGVAGELKWDNASSFTNSGTITHAGTGALSFNNMSVAMDQSGTITHSATNQFNISSNTGTMTIANGASITVSSNLLNMENSIIVNNGEVTVSSTTSDGCKIHNNTSFTNNKHLDCYDFYLDNATFYNNCLVDASNDFSISNANIYSNDGTNYGRFDVVSGANSTVNGTDMSANGSSYIDFCDPSGGTALGFDSEGSSSATGNYSNCTNNHSGTCNTVLPVELAYFELACTKDGKQLQWETLSELNNDLFIVERSKDEVSYEFVTEINGAGTTAERQFYHYAVDDEGDWYYRLQQRDFDGARTYYHLIRSRECERKNKPWLVRNIRGEAGHLTMHLEAMNYQEVEISLYDMVGRPVLVVEQELISGVTWIVQEVSQLCTGIYIAVITGGGVQHVENVVLR